MPEPRLTAVDLLVVGGLTIDRFPDGTSVAGGSVLHAARAAAGAGFRVGVIATAGPEPEAAEALAELRRAGSVQVHAVERSIGFEHGSADGARQLRFLGSGASLSAAPAGVRARVALFAPVAGELGPELGGQRDGALVRGAILQGWLRRLVPGELVTSQRIADLDAPTVEVLSGMDVLIASREDLAADGDHPAAQLDALRSALGPRPVLAVTDSVDGVWLDAQDRWHVPLARRVDAPSVGAGDMFAALLVGAGWPAEPDREFLSRRVEEAMRGVAEQLAGR
jgi:sugar/nucleoside kinase (ribokinase family)